jgi:hypothetical protein
MRSLKLLFLGVLALSFGCTTEMKLAKNIQKEKHKISVLCDYPDFIFFTNSLVEIPKGISDKELADFQDSLYMHSSYIRFIDDTLFFKQFKDDMRDQFQSIGIQYYESDSLKQFLANDGILYLVNFKQLEIEERWESFHDEEVFDEILYQEDFWIKGVSLNAWMDVAKVNDTVEIQRQLYQESVLKDEVDGMFFQTQWSGEVNYHYRLDTLKVSDLGELEFRAAEDFSHFIFNYIVNKEIRDRLNYLDEAPPSYEWIMRPGSRRLIPEEIE